MPDQLALFDHCPDARVPVNTRRAAFESVELDMPQGRMNCYLAIAHSANGMTADEVAQSISRTPFYSRPRITELVKMGLVKDSGYRRPNVSGRMAKVWMVRRG